MKLIDPKTLSTAFISGRTLTVSDLLQRITESGDLAPTRRRDLISGLRCLSRAIGLPPEEIPADPAWLRPRLVKFAPASIGMSVKTWQNARSAANTALARCGCLRRYTNRKADLGPEWLRLWEAVLASGDRSLKPSLGRLVYFLNHVGIRPDEVSDAHALSFRDALAENEINKSPETAYRAAVYGWNLAVKRLSVWPQQTLSLDDLSRRYKLPIEQFSEGFRTDLDRFVASMECPDLLDPDALAAPLRAATVTHYRRQTIRFASALVHAGVAITDIGSLSTLVAPAAAEQGLRWMLDRNGGRSSRGIEQTTQLLVFIGKRYVRVSDSDQAALVRLAGRLAMAKHSGMTAKNRARLRPLSDPRTLRRLLRLPEDLFFRAHGATDRLTNALEREDALMLAIVLSCPVRRQNLAEIHLDRNLHRTADGRVFLVFAAQEIKNGRHIEFELGASLVDMINRHLASRSPRLCPPGTPWLFPSRDGCAPINKERLSERIKTRLRKEIGLEFNAHLFRHLAAKLMLDAHPGAYEATRRLLGHAQLSHTLNAYVGFESDTAARLFAEVIDTARAKS